MKPTAIPIAPMVPIDQRNLAKLRARADYVENIGDIPEVGKQGSNVTDDVYTITGHCELFDLSKETDRKRYAELNARLVAGADVQLQWEERIPNGTGALNIVVTYVEYVLVHHSESVSVNIKDIK